MIKPDFNQIFEYDSATEEHCIDVVNMYRAYANDAAESAGKLVLTIAKSNPNVELDWCFISKDAEFD